MNRTQVFALNVAIELLHDLRKHGERARWSDWLKRRAWNIGSHDFWRNCDFSSAQYYDREKEKANSCCPLFE